MRSGRDNNHIQRDQWSKANAVSVNKNSYTRLNLLEKECKEPRKSDEIY